MREICDIDEYYKPRNRHGEPLPHLVIIIDEFAQLKKDQPEFMDELISIAAIGRTLGVHLILATQKPAGVVDDKIWSNSRFRICLRVQSEGDSRDMLKIPNAPGLTSPDEAIFRWAVMKCLKKCNLPGAVLLTLKRRIRLAQWLFARCESTGRRSLCLHLILPWERI